MSWAAFSAISTAARQAMYLNLRANCEPSVYKIVGIFLRPAEEYEVKKVRCKYNGRKNISKNGQKIAHKPCRAALLTNDRGNLFQ